ncbi:MAG: alpha-ketoglutarate-dependent dioxygenase AlkB [Ilumatobacteraceae bacterium]
MGTLISSGRSSRRGGVPTVLPAPAERGPAQLDLAESRPARTEPLPGVVHLADWLTPEQQAALVADFRRWAEPPAGLRHPRVPTGHVMTVQSVCLGWHWWPYAYSRTADDTDGAPVKPLPDEMVALARRAVADTFGAEEGLQYEPDAAIVNLYAAGARLGLHQDGEEPSPAPVVTISLGDTCTFRLAGVERRTGPFTDVELRSGDLLVFGGPSRRIFHGVPKVAGGTGPRWIDLPGRLSITVRQTGFEAERTGEVTDDHGSVVSAGAAGRDGRRSAHGVGLPLTPSAS